MDEPTWREQYNRMKRWHTRLSESTAVDDRRSDDFHAFFICCFHLKDWLRADSSVGDGIRDDVAGFVDCNLWLRLCADLANGSKHLKLDRYARFDSPARLEKVAAAFDAAFSSKGFESQDAFVIPVAGTLLDALRVTQRCMSAWDHFLTERGLLADRDSVIEKGS